MPREAKTKTTADSNKPVKVYRARGVKAAIFENKSNTNGQESVWHKVSLQRVYKQGEEWKTTNGLGRDDLPVARLLLQRAWEWVIEAEANRKREETE